ncbi:MAG: glycosyltransferase [Candidatus Bathyarchaeota archaeon]
MSGIKPVVTIGILTRNSEKFIRSVMMSILDQDFPHDLMEIIFVDESEDQTLAIIDSWKSKSDIRMKIFTVRDAGFGKSRNKILENAEGKYILWMDSDNTLSKSYVKNQVNFMEGKPDVGIAIGMFGILPGWGSVLVLETLAWIAEFSRLARNTQSSGRFRRTMRYPSTAGSICRIEALRRVNGFDEELRGVGEDIECSKRIARAGWKCCWNSYIWYETYGDMRTFLQLYRKYYLRGHGCQTLYRKDNHAFSLPRMTPPASFLSGILYSIAAYKITSRKLCFLMPIHFVFKFSAWLIGFASAQIDNRNK